MLRRLVVAAHRFRFELRKRRSARRTQLSNERAIRNSDDRRLRMLRRNYQVRWFAWILRALLFMSPIGPFRGKRYHGDSTFPFALDHGGFVCGAQ